MRVVDGDGSARTTKTYVDVRTGDKTGTVGPPPVWAKVGYAQGSEELTLFHDELSTDSTPLVVTAGSPEIALGTAYASVVDLQGLESGSGGEVLFTVGLASGPAAGRVFSDRDGGRTAVVGGRLLEPGAFGLAEAVDWNGLAIVTGPVAPLSLDVDDPEPSRSAGDRILLRISGGSPGGTVRIVASELAPLAWMPPVAMLTRTVCPVARS